MTTDSMKQLDKQVQTLMDYCVRLKQENARLYERDRLVSGKLQKLLAQFKALESHDGQ